MSKGRKRSIFRKAEIEQPEAATPSKLAVALYGSAGQLAPPVIAPKPAAPVKVEPVEARVVVGFDATASREDAWELSTELTDALLSTLPGHLRAALAVHGGGKVHTFTGFESDIGKLRDRAAGVRCKAGYTRLFDILTRVLQTEGVGTVVYVGDMFEENESWGIKLATAMGRRRIRLIILHDTRSIDALSASDIFARMVSLTGGTVLPFDPASLDQLRDLLSAVAVLAVGGPEMLATKQAEMPAARLLLQHLGDKP